MKVLNKQKLLFIFWLILATLSASWIILNLFLDFEILFSDGSMQFVFILIILSLILSIASIREIIKQEKEKVKNERENQKNVRDIYLYYQLIDPPNIDN